MTAADSLRIVVLLGVSFGLLQVGTKLSGFAVSLAFGGLQLATGSPQSGLLALIVQLAIGWWLVRRLT